MIEYAILIVMVTFAIGFAWLWFIEQKKKRKRKEAIPQKGDRTIALFAPRVSFPDGAPRPDFGVPVGGLVGWCSSGLQQGTASELQADVDQPANSQNMGQLRPLAPTRA